MMRLTTYVGALQCGRFGTVFGDQSGASFHPRLFGLVVMRAILDVLG